jgi:hypothetical protein
MVRGDRRGPLYVWTHQFVLTLSCVGVGSCLLPFSCWPALLCSACALMYEYNVVLCVLPSTVSPPSLVGTQL